MAVIYLPPSVGGAAGFATALGQAGGSAAQAVARHLDQLHFADALQAAQQQTDPQKKAQVFAAELMRTMGPRGLKLAYDYGQLAQQAASTQNITSETTARNTLLPGQVAEQGANVANTRSETKARDTLLPGQVAQQGASLANTRANTAATVQSTQQNQALFPQQLALAQLNVAAKKGDIKLTEAQRAKLEQDTRTENVLSPLRLELTKAQIAEAKATAEGRTAEAKVQQIKIKQMQDALDLVKKLLDSGSGKESAGGVNPTGFSPSDSTSPAGVSIPLGPVQGPNPDAVQGGRGNAVGQGNTLNDTLKTLSPAEKAATVLPLTRGDVSGFSRNLLEVTKPQYEVKQEPLPNQPGFFQDYRIDERSGKKVPIGDPIDERKPAPSDVTQGSEGLGQMYGTMSVLGKLGDKIDGNRVLRQINQYLVSKGFNPILSANSKATINFETVRRHAINGVVQFLRGSRQTNWLEQQFVDNVPKLTDSKEIREAKGKTMGLIMDYAIKARYEDAVNNGYRVPPNLAQMYKERKLKDKNLEEMQSELEGVTGTDSSDTVKRFTYDPAKDALVK